MSRCRWTLGASTSQSREAVKSNGSLIHLADNPEYADLIAAPELLQLLQGLDLALLGVLPAWLAALVLWPLAAPVEPEAGAYAAGHHHHSSAARHEGIIHDFAQRAGRAP